MALTKKFEEGNKTPTLYSWYGKKYDFDQLQKDADAGLESYISGLKRGEKDSDLFRRAYRDLMAGIKDGTITFNNGRYVDSKGRYLNGQYYDEKGNKQTSNRKSKDYYGLMANYIFSRQGKSGEYIPPEDKSKIKWDGNESIGKAVTRRIFNSDTWNDQDFLDLNEYDEDGKVKGVDNRYAKLSDAFSYVLNNFDNIFTGYSDEDTSDYKQYLNQAIQALNNNKIDAGDYLTLNKVTNSLNYRKMFSDKSIQDSRGNDSPTNLTFYQWISQKHPKFSGTFHQSRSLSSTKNYGQDTLNKVQQAVNSQSDEQLQKVIQDYIMDNNYDFNSQPFMIDSFGNIDPMIDNGVGILNVLGALKQRGKLEGFGGDQSNLYYIPGTDSASRGTGWVYDSNSNTISEMSQHDIPYWQQQFIQEWNSSRGGTDPADLYYTQRYGKFFKKEGGIIKAQSGVKFSDSANYYTGVFQNQLPYILEQLKKNKDYYSYLNDMQDKHSDLYRSAGTDFQNVAYKSDLVGRYQDDYKQGYGDEFKDNKFGYNSMGIQNALANNMFSISGKRTSGDWEGKWTTDNLYSAITDFRRLLGRKGDFTDEQLSDITSQFKNAGYDLVLGNNDYYKLTPIEASPMQKTEVKSQPQSPKEPTNSTEINPTITPPKSSSTWSMIGQILPSATDIGRLGLHLWGDRKIYNELLPSLTPVLKQTFQTYSPVTGAFSEKQDRFRQAAELRRFAAQRPLTSDANLHLASLLESNKNATNLEHQGFMADDARIRETALQALARQEANKQRATQTANENRVAINQSNRERAQLKAAHIRNTTNNISQFIGDYSNKLKSWMEQNKQFQLAADLENVENDYTKAQQDLRQYALNWQSQRGNESKPLSSMPSYNNYIQAANDLSIWKNAKEMEARAKAYGYKYSNPMLSRTPSSIKGSWGFFKQGGQLNPTALRILNKVIRNENNT